MLARQGVRSGLWAWAAARPALARGYAEAAEKGGQKAEAVVSEQFKQDWQKIAPNYDMPKFPSSFMAPRPAVSSTIPTKVTVNFALPYQYEISAKEVSLHDFRNLSYRIL